jgi:hypothetical protein
VIRCPAITHWKNDAIDDIGSELVAKGKVELVIVVITQILTAPRGRSSRAASS